VSKHFYHFSCLFVSISPLLYLKTEKRKDIAKQNPTIKKKKEEGKKG
jgi:hypothetical protein